MLRLGRLWRKSFPTGHLKPYDTEYKNGLERKYKCENVVFLGEKPHDEAMKIVASSSVFTLPSYTEGFPNAVLEAMALEKPIVATSVGAIPDMLCGCGVVVPPENSRELENALSDLISNEELRNDFAKKAKHKMLGEYTIDKIFESYKTIWNEIS